MNTPLIDILLEASRSQTMPDETVRSVVSLRDTAEIARRFEKTQRDIDILALENDIIPERYIRNMKAFSIKDQTILLKSSVCIVGLGGLGGLVVETLARIGVGAMTLIDGDAFDESNLNRQLLSSEQNLSLTKTTAAVDRVAAINSSIQVRFHTENMNLENASRFIQDSAVAIDCLDNIASRFLLERTAKAAGIPMVSAAVAGYSGQLTAIFPEDKGLELIYGPPVGNEKRKGAEIRLGNLPFTVSAVASLECAEVVNILLKRKSNLRNRLLIIDLQDYTFERVRLL